MTVHLTHAQARALGNKLPPELAPAPHKFHATPQRREGRFFASACEADYVAEVRVRERSGEVADVELQPKVTLVAGITYKPDVVFTDTATGVRKWIEVKGVVSDRFRLVMKLWRYSGPGLLVVVKRKSKRSGFQTVREIMPELRA